LDAAHEARTLAEYADYVGPMIVPFRAVEMAEGSVVSEKGAEAQKVRCSTMAQNGLHNS
jgi:hypothetical protein